MGSAEIVVAHGIWRFLSGIVSYIPVQVSVIGASNSGKTSLDAQLITQGAVRELGEEDRTHHKKGWLGNYQLPDATKKRVKSEGLAKTLVSRDLGGHVEYHSTWLRDMVNRNCNTVIVVIDHRHLVVPNNVDNQTALGYLVTAMKKQTKPKGLSLKGRWRWSNYAPRRVILLANKADEWMDMEAHQEWEKGFIARHKIFDVFREDLHQLQSMYIPVYIDAISARYGWNVQDSIMKGFEI